MAGRSVDSLLSPLVVLDRISRLDLPGTSISRLLGWNIANFASATLQGATREYPLRTGQYDIFDITRKIASGRVPGTGPSKQKPQKVGTVQFTIPRSAEMIELTDEDLDNRRQLGGNASMIDRNGLRYVEAQIEYLAQRFSNIIEFQAAAMCRGSYTFDQNDDDLEHRFTGGELSIDFQIPAGNKDGLDMLGGGNLIGASWATAGTDIPLHLININKAFVELTGQGLAHIICRGQTWNNVINNDKVKAQAGSSYAPFDTYNRKSAGEFTAVLRALPWLQWHIVDYGLEVWDGSAYTYETLLEDDHAIFMPEPNPRWVEYIVGGERVTEGPNGRKSFQYGFYPYSYPTHHPSGRVLAAVFNGLPSLLRPKAIAYGDTTP